MMEENNDCTESPQQGQGRNNAVKCGWLRKQGGFVKTWHTRWFVLKGDQLYYFKDEDETKPLGTIFLPGNKVLEHPCNEESPGKFLFEVVPVEYPVWNQIPDVAKSLKYHSRKVLSLFIRNISAYWLLSEHGIQLMALTPNLQ
nr:rho GTPase-activating protein 24-like isoform X2 [Halichoerus grypus]XP_035921035.1 rho GTPase-activating protein 24-like isoform X2 [Halichoerus grypus]XP_035921036.1 rho GTPase-activating protein 24-like isoform X2 [Halichoerus grypus]XP_035921038.1 rho GTPase-activating protein 24-like isoform X2 [Halichoerus grypus]XP_035921039.1 rho GTPase-activating protein 24-like isoform X2 [Halichoerus grypus]